MLMFPAHGWETLYRVERVFNLYSQDHPGALTSPSHLLLWEVLSPPGVSGAASPTHTKSLFSPSLPRHDPAAKGEYRHLCGLCLPVHGSCVCPCTGALCVCVPE